MGKKTAVSRRTPENSGTRALPRDRSETIKYLENDEIQRLFSVIKSKRDKAIFRVTYHRGLRAHEVALLDMADYRDRDGVLFVTRGKGSVTREHSLTTEEIHCMRQWIKERGTMPGPIFLSRNHKGISRDRLDELMKFYCKLAGIPNYKAHMHALKHSCGTILAERGATAAEIQEWLGHRSSQSTDIYMHFSRKRRRELEDKHRDWK